MERSCWVLILVATALVGCVAPAGEPTEPLAAAHPDWTYPKTRRVEQVDVYHGTKVADPYRWLEEDGDETRQWIDAQGALLDGYVDGLPSREALEQRLLQLRDVDSIGIPVRAGKRYFERRARAADVHGTVWVRDGLDGVARQVLDYADIIDDPLHRSSGFNPSRDGRWLVWAVTDPQGWGVLDVARVADGKPIVAERIEGVAGNSTVWTHDSEGFFYSRYGDLQALRDGAEPRDTLMYHRLGTPASADETVYARDDRPNMLFTPKLSDDGRWLVLQLNDEDRRRNQVLVLDLKKKQREWRPLIEEADALYRFEGNDGRRFFFATTLNAPKTRLIAIDLDRPERQHWTEIVPEGPAPITSVSRVGDRLIVRTTEHARPVVDVRKLDGTLERTLDLPVIGSVGGFADDPDSTLTFFSTGNLFDSRTVWRIDVASGKSQLHSRPTLHHDPDDYELRQVFYSADDGTRIPMFLAHRKDVPLRGDNPLFMYGYGHGGWVAFPWYQPHLIAWMDLGGVYALPGIRGGGEYGDAWRQAGTGTHKQTTIDDYLAAAQFLVDRGYTSPGKLVANGGSASGVLPAAAMIRRPDLFGAAIIDFPFLDMLRYHRFTRIAGWTKGYGSSDDADEFSVLRAYSPLHNLKDGTCYPATLTIVGENDSATVPMHGYKFTAALQAAQGCPRPAMLKFIPGVGHYSYGSTKAETVETEAHILAFLIRSLGMRPTTVPSTKPRRAAL